MKNVLSAILIATVVPMAAIAGPQDGDRHGAPLRAERPTDAAPLPSRVLDLLDEDVFLRLRGDREAWVSASFDTSRFTRIGLKAASSGDSDPIACRVEWSYGPNDGFTPGLPAVQLGGPIRFIFSGDERPDDDPALFVVDSSRPAVTMGEVAGLRARVRCQPTLGGDFGRIPGDDDPDPPAAEGTLTDVKVLLRRN